MRVIFFGAGWSETLGYNLQHAAVLWCAWYGGARTMREALEGGGAPIYTFAKDEDVQLVQIGDPPDPGPEPEPEKPRHLKLVP